MAVAYSTRQYRAGWVPPGLDAMGGGRVGGALLIDDEWWGVPARKVSEDGHGHAPPTISEQSPGSPQIQRRVLSALTFFGTGDDHRDPFLHLIATADAEDRYELWARGCEALTAGARKILMRSDGSGRWSVFWVEENAWVNVQAKGVSEPDLLRFVSELYLVNVEPGQSGTLAEPT